MDEFRGQEVLITGGLGFIGSNLAIRLVGAGASVTILDNLDSTCGGNHFNIDPIRDDVAAIDGDCRDLALVRNLVRGKSHVFSLAGNVNHLQSMQNPFADLQQNVVGPLTVLEACRLENRDARIVYAGTRQAYGRPESLPVRETQLLKPIDVNGVNKMAGERYHIVYHQAYGMPAVSLRLVNTFGPRQLVKHAGQGFMGLFIRQAIDGEEIQVFGDGQQLRSLNYVDDAVDGLLTAATHACVTGDCFNLGGTEAVTLEAIAQLLLKTTGRGSYRIVPFPADKKAIDIGSIYCSYEKFNAATGWKPRVSLEEGLARTVDYCQRYHAHYW